jgi:hypothetical protein
MKSPTVKFQLKPYQLARGLASIRRLDPTYQPSSIHQLVKLIYFDYCAKTSIGHTDAIPQTVWNDLYKILPGVTGRPSQMDDATLMQEARQLLNTTNVVCHPIADQSQLGNTTRSKALTNDADTTSIINTVNDFSLPEDLLNEISGDSQNEDK